MRVRISWGGGERRLWKGTIALSEGEISEPRWLGIEADAPNGLELTPRQLTFQQRTPVSFDGVDVRLSGPADAVLSVELVPSDQRDKAQKVDVPLSEFIQLRPIVRDAPLDDRQNRLQFQRAPGDRLRVAFERDSLVFSPGERFEFRATPHLLGVPEGTVLRCAFQLQYAGEDTGLKEQHEVRVGADGSASSVGPVTWTLPEDEGPYDVLMSLYPRRFSDAIVPTKPLIQRKVQLVVVGETRSSADKAEWQLVEQIDSTNPKWWERWMWIPQWKKWQAIIPGVTPHGPLGAALNERLYGNTRLHEIVPRGWHAAPIPIAEVGQPHLLEIEYPSDLRQTLGISILEPDAAGLIGTQGIDSGVDVSTEIVSRGQEARLETHRLVFWPRSKTPWLLLTNRRDDLPAVFGKMRVFVGSAALAPAPLENRSADLRLTTALLDKPLFAEMFGAPEALDEASQRSLRDWGTFYLGAIRLADYLKYAGYNSLLLPVNGDGTALYPTRSLDPIPKFDNGTFFVSGQDPLPKDLLELLFRVFDREGLTLIPAVQFGVPLPELEAALRAEPNDWNGIQLIGAFAGDRRAMLGRADHRRGLAPYYNPLDPRVQAAMRRVTRELLQRCQGHASFGGLAVQLTPFGYAQLPDDGWGLDGVTFSRFMQKNRLTLPASEADAFAQRLTLVRGEWSKSWRQWRAAELAGFYRQLQSDITGLSPSARLYFDLHELAAGRVVQSSLRPQLPARDEFEEAMLRHGLDLSALAKLPNAVLLRPYRVAPVTSLAAQAPNLELTQSERVEAHFRQSGPSGVVAFHEPQVLRLAEFDRASPLGPDKTYTWLVSHISPAGARARAELVRGLVALDAGMLATGGWKLPLGQEDSLRPVLEVMGQLPAEAFETVASRQSDESSTYVAVRMLRRQRGLYVYAANATSLRGKLSLEVPHVSAQVAIENLSSRTDLTLQRSATGTWTVQLGPYDVAGWVIADANAKIVDWSVEFERQDVVAVGRLAHELRARVSDIREPRPVSVLANPAFDRPGAAEQGEVAGWTALARPGVTVELDRRTYRSAPHSLHVKVTGAGVTTRVRSETFALPKTGRLSVLARFRTADSARQPPLRMAIEGTLSDGTPLYRWSEPMGLAVDGQTLRPTGAAARALPTQWTEDFLFHVVNLPAGTSGQVAIGFDILGAGDVWIDDIEVYDLYFQPQEFNELVKQAANANLQLEVGKFAACQQTLEGFWPRFVLEHAPPPRLTQAPAEPVRSAHAGQERPVVPAEPQEKPSKWRLLPRLPVKLPLY